MSQPNSSGDEQPLQTPSDVDVAPVAESTTGQPLEDQAVQDLIAESMLQSKEEDEGDASAGDDAAKPDGDSPKPDPAAPEPKPEDKAKETSVEKSKEDPKPDPKPDSQKKEESVSGEEPFAKLGDQVFKTKEELIKFAKQTSGFNRTIVGNLKKTHPDWFDEKGQLKPDRMKAVKAASDAVSEQVNEDQPTTPTLPAHFTENDKQKLRDMGFVFKEDLAPIQDAISQSDDEALKGWIAAHPKASGYEDEIVELMEATENLPEDRRLHLDSAWSFVAQRHGIVEENPKTDNNTSGRTYEEGRQDERKKAALDGAGGSAPGGSQQGAAPQTTDSDIMDQILNATVL